MVVPGAKHDKYWNRLKRKQNLKLKGEIQFLSYLKSKKKGKI